MGPAVRKIVLSVLDQFCESVVVSAKYWLLFSSVVGNKLMSMSFVPIANAVMACPDSCRAIVPKYAVVAFIGVSNCCT